jgi:hypothetical protein
MSVSLHGARRLTPQTLPIFSVPGPLTSLKYTHSGPPLPTCRAKKQAVTPLGVTTYTYDSLGRTETLTDGRGVKEVFAYDNLDRIKTVSTTNDTVLWRATARLPTDPGVRSPGRDP